MDDFSDKFFPQDANTETELEQTTETPLVEAVETIEPETVQTETDAVETEAPAASEPKMVPLSAVHAERQRAKDAIDQVNALRQQIAAFEATTREVPDPYDDPAGYTVHQQQLIAAQVQEALKAQRFHESTARVVAAHGQEYLEEVSEWAQSVAATDPTFEAKVFAQPDPAAWVIEQKQRSDMLAAFQADPDAFILAEATKRGLAAVAQTSAPQPTGAKPLGPKSLASAKSRDAASNNQTSAEDAFHALFNKR